MALALGFENGISSCFALMNRTVVKRMSIEKFSEIVEARDHQLELSTDDFPTAGCDAHLTHRFYLPSL